jgi:hypothetical protein
MAIPVRELKAKLSSVLLRAAGRSDRGHGPRQAGIPPNAGAGLRGLIASGALSWTGGKPSLEPPLELEPTGTPISQMILEDRG